MNKFLDKLKILTIAKGHHDILKFNNSSDYEIPYYCMYVRTYLYNPICESCRSGIRRIPKSGMKNSFIILNKHIEEIQYSIICNIKSCTIFNKIIIICSFHK